jgi:eukaryotic-like serine/threonine-protein kinase
MTEKTELTERMERLTAALGGRYRVDREIGFGGMAIVYAAHDLRHDREVAIKVLLPDVASSIGADRFLGEIRTTARLSHPNILPLFDSGEAAGLLFFVMPLVVGQTLRQRMDSKSPLPLDAVLAIGTDLCSALDHAHRQGVIHRDIKPENILLQDGRAVLADFGIALARRPDDLRLTGSGIAVGTPAYMSPEQVLGERALDARSDIYSVGTVLYEMLAGVPPFGGPTMQAVVAKALTEPPVPPSRHRRDIPAHVDAAVLAALEKDPARRPATAEELRAMLTAPQTPARPSRARRVRIAATTVATIAVIAIGLVFTTWKRAAADPVIAIFPFTNITGDTSNTPLGQGLPLAIFDALRPLHLNVIPIETSSDLTRHYAHDNAASLGRRLNASAMLLGKFERDGGRVRIHVQLIDVGSGGVLWSNQFNGSSNLFDMEDSVALAVANAMRVTLNDSQRASMRTVPTVRPEVHRVVVRALGYIERRDAESLHAGVDLLNTALAMDSTYAPAWAALGRAHTLLGVYAAGDSDFVLADSAVEHALRLDDRLAGAHLTRATLHVFHDHDYPAAAIEFQRSIALDPTDASTWLFRSWYYLATDQPDSALITIRLARKLDPNSSIIRAREGTVLYYVGRFAESETVLRSALVADSGNTFARGQLVEVYGETGQCDAARRLAAQIPPTPEQFENSYTTYALARCGDVAGAVKYTAALESRASHGGYVDPYAIARVYASVGDTAHAWRWLGRAVTTGAWDLWCVPTDPAFKQYRNDAHFQLLDERARHL